MKAHNDNIQPRGFNRATAATYIGIGTTLFDQMVVDGRMPTARMAGGRVLWDRFELDEAFDALPRQDRKIETSPVNPWDDVA